MKFLAALLVVLNARLALSSCGHGTVLHPRAAAGEAVELPNFGYGADNGPTNWHGLSADNVLCAAGTNQSPINIDSTIPTEQPGFITMNVAVQDVVFENLGTNVEVVLTGESTIGGRQFALEQFHFHSPSEHLVNGEHFAAEVHLVHVAKDSPEEILVVAMLIEASGTSSVDSFDTLMSNINRIPTPGQTTTVPALDISQLATVANTIPFFNYKGSLTTPPCTEGVTFLVSTKTLPLGVDNFNLLKNVVKGNARFVQRGIPATENVLVSSFRSLPLKVRQESAANASVATTSATERDTVAEAVAAARLRRLTPFHS
ncbi:hypothetical protein AJ80_00452 [Polytolypa hystricis UAMH7299]|uniref:Carbonic anhydrase n=1 Tax=Polytolypa hystricis (strain UAMH7299) TaxID=1447883 RepID=A0A2B7Z4B2_POLH7|nr:hypothetical protein AJ80_00452 [Polytolypa hystricis UAMH7299]